MSHSGKGVGVRSRPSSAFSQRLAGWLLWPVQPLPRPEQVRNASLVAFLLLVLLLAILIEQIWYGNTPLIIIPFLLAAYGLSRTKYFMVATLLTILVLSYPSYFVALRMVSPSAAEVTQTMVWISLPILLSSLLLPLWAMALLALAHAVFMLLLPGLNPAISFVDLVGSLGFVLPLSLVVFIVARQRNLLEQDRQRELQRSREALHLALDAANMGAWEWVPDTGTVSWSVNVAPLLGLPPDTFDGRFETYLSLVVEEDRPAVQASLGDALAGGQDHYYVQHRVTRPGGEVHWLEGLGRAHRTGTRNDPGGLITGILADITPRKAAEAERERLIRELGSKNLELERFTYTVSHDLKSPLITIQGFLDFLQQDIASQNEANVATDMHYIRQASERMFSLLNDLLALSRAGRVIRAPQAVPFGDLAQEAVDLVAGQTTRQQVQVTIQPDMPAVLGDRVRLVQVLQNLLDNAIKYMGDQPQPQVIIGSRVQDGETVFFVTDNGMGIAPRHYERIFGLFERLSNEVEGSGLGLALVKRIVETHQGRVWLESAHPDRGTTFYFTLPLVES
ncbi:MAG: PAS domain-containing sensor histidine kinase [Ardenticatenaceae bacterium]|nr:PAS domain-containing sensor histidine kinase [Anaerolineales bacterium]MCB8919480.1 PAS domain-containing sensor histidine kinase [Ardenticatenaceae bacterium]